MESNLKEILNNRKIPVWSELPEIDLYMDQIIMLMEKYLGTTHKDKLITPSMINNYVKLGIIPPPDKKKYSKTHIAYLIIICSLKQVMPIPDIKILIEERLKKYSIEELLNEYSKLFSNTINKVVDLSNVYEKETDTDSAMYLAVCASICRYSSQLFLNDTSVQENDKDKDKNKNKEKAKSKEKNK